MRYIALWLAATLMGAQALALLEAVTNTHPLHSTQAWFRDDFETLDTDVWRCEYTCPVIEGEKARFRLTSGIAPSNHGSWSKTRYTPSRFTSGTFTVRFALTSRPAGMVWWGVALYDHGPVADGSQFNEINFGYTTHQSYSNSELRLESARRGDIVSHRVDTGVDLYDEQWHTATLEYDASHVSFYLDGTLLDTISNVSVIPTDAMDLVLGTRVVPHGLPLTTGFTQSIDWVEVES
ncbi:hypothetical protein S7711_10839 [Stachybotrys chartarum IBT 7711]|uniref:GH16 domain-containing protein n=1 Tax=Stachybotrys chartarum (strain CBS 109288 / IBT 7711) TaxID=1280523 RepID=A0A084B5L0_STACB|nr:hypothetical protein S7711_10839 [Stachybotrys chartarum IBT 7711]KFA73451.1 hypothetical protein S40288_10889 [Stachybotrys chartarum IBT 40288]